MIYYTRYNKSDEEDHYLIAKDNKLYILDLLYLKK